MPRKKEGAVLCSLITVCASGLTESGLRVGYVDPRGQRGEGGDDVSDWDDAGQSAERAKAAEGAARVDLADFSAALTSGVLRAVEARRPARRPGLIDWRPWIWAGWIIGEGGPLGDPDRFPGSDPSSGQPPA